MHSLGPSWLAGMQWQAAPLAALFACNLSQNRRSVLLPKKLLADCLLCRASATLNGALPAGLQKPRDNPLFEAHPAQWQRASYNTY